ncbi:MAG TPA: LPS export ABC transporter periplasmic protein LptC, partial [Pyrinomonadaceae bacterium]|nr:LPS export ABC transporter periplasmic protein LptC [Pyrinomonadaceae bacterium]
MPDNETQTKREYRVRASLPRYFRVAAIAAIGVTLLAIVAGFYNARSKSPFRLKSEHAQLSTDVISEISGYERLETEDGVTKYYIKADHAKTFSDNHQELQNVYLEVFDKEGVQNDKMAAESAIYIPEPEKNFTAYLKGNVRIDTRQGLKIKTNHVVYSRKTEVAEADEAVEFERENIRGKSFGATVKIADKRVELLKDVDIELFESPELARANVRYGRVTANSASFDQLNQKISANHNVAINIVSTAKGTGRQQTTDIAGNRAELSLAGENTASAQLKTIELFENVRITSVEQGMLPTNIESGYALYDKPADRFELKNGAHIVTAAGEKPTDLRATEAIYEQTARKVALTGGAEIVQGSDTLKGDVLFATLFADNKVKDAVIRGNASARQTTAERTTTITAPELNATFDAARHMRDANAIGQSSVELTPAVSQDYSRVTAAATRGIGLVFKGEGLLDSMHTDGRTTINLNAPNNTPDAANKRLTADKVNSYFHPNGKDIRRAEAVGNAELFVDPLNAGKDNYRTTIDAPRFDCEFFPTGNNAKTCIGGKRAKAVRVPTVRDAKRGDQTLTADQLTAHFSQRSNDIETFDAAGSAKFNELDR